MANQTKQSKLANAYDAHTHNDLGKCHYRQGKNTLQIGDYIVITRTALRRLSRKTNNNIWFDINGKTYILDCHSGTKRDAYCYRAN
jgi:hypothetical protein